MLYWMLSGAVTAHRYREIFDAIAQPHGPVLCVPTPNSGRVLAPRELARELARMPGNRLIESYFDEALVPRAPLLPLLWAPCSFNSLNKLAHGIADSLALSIAAEMIGAQKRVTVALSLNRQLWDHPQARASAARLRAWGVDVIDPVVEGDTMTMAPTDVIAKAL
jgi:hypothetical protein